MSTEPDDDALSWAGDDDPTLAGSKPATAPAESAPPAPTGEKLSGGWRVVGKPGTATAAADAVTPSAPTQMSSTALVIHGVLGGVYLLYVIGWLIASQRMVGAPSDIVGSAMFTVGLWFAVLSPALWFGAALWLTRGASSIRWRVVALIGGVVVLAPWPFIVGAR